MWLYFPRRVLQQAMGKAYRSDSGFKTGGNASKTETAIRGGREVVVPKSTMRKDPTVVPRPITQHPMCQFPSLTNAPESPPPVRENDEPGGSSFRPRSTTRLHLPYRRAGPTRQSLAARILPQHTQPLHWQRHRPARDYRAGRADCCVRRDIARSLLHRGCLYAISTSTCCKLKP